MVYKCLRYICHLKSRNALNSLGMLKAWTITCFLIDINKNLRFIIIVYVDVYFHQNIKFVYWDIILTLALKASQFAHLTGGISHVFWICPHFTTGWHPKSFSSALMVARCPWQCSAINISPFFWADCWQRCLLAADSLTQPHTTITSICTTILWQAHIFLDGFDFLCAGGHLMTLPCAFDTLPVSEYCG